MGEPKRLSFHKKDNHKDITEIEAYKNLVKCLEGGQEIVLDMKDQKNGGIVVINNKEELIDVLSKNLDTRFEKYTVCHDGRKNENGNPILRIFPETNSA